MIAAQVVSIDWNTVYNAIVLTVIAVSQIYLDFAIIVAQRQAAKERRIAIAKEKAAAEEAVRQHSGEHAAID